MILKTRTQDRGQGIDVWNYYDGIKSASVYWNEEIKLPCIAMRFEDGANEIILGIQDLAFLLNDNGKTVERISPRKNNEI